MYNSRFLFGGYLKLMVYVDIPKNLQELKDLIRDEVHRITPEVIHNL